MDRRRVRVPDRPGREPDDLDHVAGAPHGRRDAEGLSSERSIRPTRLEGRALVNVAGESHYQDALHEIAGTSEGEVRLEATAALVPEPSNPHDPNAVRVEIDGKLVGYLPRAAAVAYGPAVNEPASRGRTAVCDAMVAGRGGVLGVFLKLPELE